MELRHQYEYCYLNLSNSSFSAQKLKVRFPYYRDSMFVCGAVSATSASGTNVFGATLSAML